MKHFILGLTCLAVSLSAKADVQGHALYKQGAAVYKTDPEQAYALFVQAAEAGHPQALASAGYCCETGTGTVTNYTQAIIWYAKAIEHNSLEACEGLARIYASAVNPEFHDGTKAVKYATAVVRKKPRDVDALTLLASAYVRNYEFNKAIKASQKVCRVAPLDRNEEAKVRHLDYLIGKPRPAMATDEWLLKASNAGSVWAMSELAARCEDIDDEMYDLEKARLWYERAAEQGGQAYDLYQIGRYYVHGIGGSVDVEKGILYLDKAAETGSDHAHAELGNLYLSGTLVPRDSEKAYEHFNAMEQINDQLVIYKRDFLKTKAGAVLDEMELENLNDRGKEACTPRKGPIVKDAQGRIRRPHLSYRWALIYYLMAAEHGYVPAMKSAADLCLKGGRWEKTRSSINDLEEQALKESLLKSVEDDETIPLPKEAARWYFELTKSGNPYLPNRFHENFTEMAKWYNELARRDGTVTPLKLD